MAGLPHDLLFYLVASFAVLMVGLAKGGFSGLGMASIPLLALVMDPVKAAAMMLPILIVQDVVGVWAFRKTVDVATLKLMMPGAVLGIGLGWAFASLVPVNGVRALVGGVSMLFGGNQLLEMHGLGVRIPEKLPSWIGTLCGALAGFTSQVAHAGGPPFQIWALTRNFSHIVYAGTAAVFFAALNWVKVPAYWQLGQFTGDNLRLSAVFMPLALLSTLGGVWLIKRIPAARFQLAINALMLIVGAALLMQASL